MLETNFTATKKIKNGLSTFYSRLKKSVREATGGGVISQANLKNFVVKAVGLISQAGGGRSGDFSTPEYSLEEIKNAANSDSYIKISLQKYSQLIFKAGYTITSDNDAAAEYLRQRFRLMSFCTGTPIDITFQEIGDDLIKYSNAFLVKSRMDQNLGGIQAKAIYDTKPVGGYFRVDPSTMQIKRDTNGTIKQYMQSVDGEEKTYKATDVIHMYLDREGGAAFGTPRIVAALEDVKLLRKIEGNVLSLIYRFAIPLYQMIIGLPQTGFMATDKEIEDARSEVEKMAMDGIIVTNERTKFASIGAEGTALDATGYLSYFEKRVITALNMSEAMMGRGGNKQDADSMEGQVHDTVKNIQRTMAIFIENLLINELLLEGGYNPIFNEQDIVNFSFNEINLDTKVKMENHELYKFQSNVIPFEEARKNLGKRADNVDETRLYANMIENKNSLEQINAKNQAALQIAGITKGSTSNTVPSTGSLGNGTTKSVGNKVKGAVASIAKPTNQHGTTSANIKEFIESTEDKNKTTKSNVKAYRKNFEDIYKKYQEARNDICERSQNAEIILPIAKDSLKTKLISYIQMAAIEGSNKAFKDSNQPFDQLEKIQLGTLEDRIDNTLTQLFKDIQKQIKGKEKNKQYVMDIFDVLEYRLRFLAEYIIPKAYWYAYVKTCHRIGIDKVYIDFNGSDHEKDHSGVIKTNNFGIDDVPAYSAYCNCKITLTRKAGE